MSDPNPSPPTPPPSSPMLTLRLEAARRLGCEVELLDPETGYLVELRQGERRHVLLGGTTPLNDALAGRLADDKFHTSLLLRRAGFRVPTTVRCLKQGRFELEDFPALIGLAQGQELAATAGFPLVVKPNRGSRGRDVVVVADADELATAVRRVWENDYLALVQTLVEGVDVRLDFLDGEYLFGYVRAPVVLRGDGRSPLRRLFTAADPRFTGGLFERVLAGEPAWRAAVRERGIDLDSVLAAETELDLASPILNLNRLCVAELVRELPPDWLAAGREVGRTLGLRHYGVDFRAPSFAAGPAGATVLEVNGSPSLVQMSRRGYLAEALAAEERVVRAILEGAAGS